MSNSNMKFKSYADLVANLKGFKLGGVRCPRQGEYYIAVKNHGGEASIQRATKKFKYVVCQCLILDLTDGDA